MGWWGSFRLILPHKLHTINTLGEVFTLSFVEKFSAYWDTSCFVCIIMKEIPAATHLVMYYLAILSILSMCKPMEMFCLQRAVIQKANMWDRLSAPTLSPATIWKRSDRRWFQGWHLLQEVFDSASGNQNSKFDEWFMKTQRADVIYFVWDTTNPHTWMKKKQAAQYFCLLEWLLCQIMTLQSHRFLPSWLRDVSPSP